MNQKDLSMLKNKKINLLILGPPGVGKSYFAKEFIKNSIYETKPFIHLSLTSLHEHTFESELFGHQKGSFTGAINDRKGFLEEVKEGTLFLDEIGDLDFKLQSKLLQILEEKIYYPIGSNQLKIFIGRMILATHRDLSQMVKEGTFRKDLYDRITQFVYKIPSLDENISLKKDLITKFWNMFCEIHQKKMELNHEIKDLLVSCPMEGNIRELKQIIEKIVLLSFSHDSIQTLVKLTSPTKSSKLPEETYPDHYYEAKEKFERAYFEKKYAEFNGKVNLMAKKTNLSKVTLLSKLKHYDLKNHYV